MRAIASVGCEGSMRAVASSMTPNALPRQGPTPKFCTATAGGITAVQTCVSAAAKLCQRPRLVKSKSPQRTTVAVQIEQYLLFSAAQLTSCSSPAVAASWVTSSMLPRIGLLRRRRKPTV